MLAVWVTACQVWCGLGGSREQTRTLLAPTMQAFHQTPFACFERYSPSAPGGRVKLHKPVAGMLCPGHTDEA